MTRYVVLRKDASGYWSMWGDDVEARGAEDAIRTALLASEPGTFVAIPARSWKPLTVEVEQVQRVTVKAASA